LKKRGCESFERERRKGSTETGKAGFQVLVSWFLYLTESDFRG
jgi:hypothetical protein